jgi:hypothetical protein
MLLACSFDSTLKNLEDPFDSELLRSVRFRGRNRAGSPPGTRYPHISSALATPAVFHSPLGHLKTLRIKAFKPVLPQEARLAERPIVFRSPPRSFESLRINA